MAYPLHITPEDLTRWADTPDGKFLLPALLRRLVLTTSPVARISGFREGGGGFSAGVDGETETGVGTTFVPVGRCTWEFGTDSSPKRKADTDYKKRTAGLAANERAPFSFVVVTLRRWTGGDEWARSKRAKNEWADVRVVDADQLRAWLDAAPAVEIWLGHQLGRHVPGVMSLHAAAAEYTDICKPTLGRDLLLAGRSHQAEELRQLLREVPRISCVQGDTVDEVVAFLHAAINGETDPVQRESWLHRALVVDSKEAGRTVTAAGTTPNILVLRGVDPTPHAAANGHHVIVANSVEHRGGSASMLPRPTRLEFTAALRSMGLDDRAADLLARDAHGSISVLRRKLALIPSLGQPAWSRPEHGVALAPLLLFGCWNTDSEPERTVVASVVGSPYDEIDTLVRRWANVQDAPFERVGSTWRWRCREDAWALLAHQLPARALQGYKDAVVSALGGIDPRFDLPEADRWLAPVRGKSPRLTEGFRCGLADAAALLATRHAAFDPSLSQDAINVSTLAVREVLRASSDFRIWATLSRLLPSLAEAAPEEFLGAVERFVGDHRGELMALLRGESDNHYGGTCLHAGLLWAIEGLCWSPRYLSRCAVLLGRLAEADPGGRWSNRPSETLRQVFLPWYPQTCADHAGRLDALDLMLRRTPQAAWALLISLLPQNASDSSGAIHQPRWRDWADGWQQGVTQREYYDQVLGIADRLASTVGQDVERWVALLSAVQRLPEDSTTRLVKEMESIDWEHKPGSHQQRLAAALREVIHRHRAYGSADWALPEHLLSRFEAVYERIDAKDDADRWSWLFTQAPHILRPPPARDFEQHFEAVRVARHHALERIMITCGPERVVRLAEEVAEPWILGQAAGAHVDASRMDACVLGMAEPMTRAQQLLARGFSQQRGRADLATWTTAIETGFLQGSLSADYAGLLLSELPFAAPTWDLLEAGDARVRDSYWRQVSPQFMPDRSRDGERGVRGLLTVGRPGTAFSLLKMMLPDRRGQPYVSPKLVAETLHALSTSAEAGVEPLDEYFVSQAFAVLDGDDDLDGQQLVLLEWRFLPFLRHGQRGPVRLYDALNADPEFFLEVLFTVVPPEGSEDDQPSEQRRAMARRGYQLLQAWPGIPGRDADSRSISLDALTSWVERARSGAACAGRGAVADQIIGSMLSHAPSGTDGAWPCEAVRELIDALSSEEMDKGISMGVYNRRGVFTKAMGDGGAQEREIAARYEQHARASDGRWPRTAAVLRGIATGYLDFAFREDERARRDEDL